MERETRRGTPRSRKERPAGERAKKPTDEDTWEARLMNSIRAQLKATRERQGMTFDTLAERCKALGYPLSRVVLSKIEAGYRPHISVPELLVLARALNTAPLQLMAPVGTPDVVWPVPGIEVTAWDAACWLSGVYLPEAMTTDLPQVPGNLHGDEAEYSISTEAVALYRKHAQLNGEWRRVAAEVRAMRLERGDELDLIARRQQPIVEQIGKVRDRCRAMSVALPPVDGQLLRALNEDDEAQS